MTAYILHVAKTGMKTKMKPLSDLVITAKSNGPSITAITSIPHSTTKRNLDMDKNKRIPIFPKNIQADLSKSIFTNSIPHDSSDGIYGDQNATEVAANVMEYINTSHAHFDLPVPKTKVEVEYYLKEVMSSKYSPQEGLHLLVTITMFTDICTF